MRFDDMTLDAIGTYFGTDKAAFGHNYLNAYERYFAPLRHRQLKILEIGIFDGASLRSWAAYFPHSSIVGADIAPATRRFAEPRIAVELLDQSNIEELVRLGAQHGPFDIIVEDGSHLWEHQITTLRTLFPFLRNGGIYVVEDLQTNYGGMGNGFRGVATMSCMDYLKQVVDLRVAGAQLDIAQEEDAFLRTYGRSMNLHFYRHCCLIEKDYAEIPHADLDPGPALRPVSDEAVIPVSLLAHIGAVGDVFSQAGAASSTIEHGNIQGFRLNVGAALRQDLFYAARLADGSWSEWILADGFAGTRGAFMDLTGFRIRLHGALAAQAEAVCIGSFRGAPDLVVVGPEEDCVAPDGTAVMYGMQVILRRR